MKNLPASVRVSHIRVAAALLAEAAFGAVAGDEDGLVAHGPEPFGDGGDQGRVIATGEVAAADTAREQHVADEGALDGRGVEDHMAGRVAGAVAHVQGFPADLHRVAIGQPARGREVFRRRKAEHLALLGQAADPELVAWMRADDG